ncbi:MAG: hypothetical protein AAFZ10_08455 [Pseudomonadota bacterium]
MDYDPELKSCMAIIKIEGDGALPKLNVDPRLGALQLKMPLVLWSMRKTRWCLRLLNPAKINLP